MKAAGARKPQKKGGIHNRKVRRKKADTKGEGTMKHTTKKQMNKNPTRKNKTGRPEGRITTNGGEEMR